jgi:hypothetical protein
MKNHITQYESKLKTRQLECWSRWVDAKVMYRDLKKRNLPFEWMEPYLENSWYTMTEEMVKQIKEKYKQLKK